MRPKRGLTALAITVALSTAASGAAFAHPEPESDGGVLVSDNPRDTDQHGDSAGHLPASQSDNIDLVSKIKLKNVVPEKIADVGILGDFAYLA
ncbi:MAG TPA: hypothetical protein VFC57_07375, partial [Aeromicrobium sp.]|nr:hypothetical protein [Aeromicrobium sp.]